MVVSPMVPCFAQVVTTEGTAVPDNERHQKPRPSAQLTHELESDADTGQTLSIKGPRNEHKITIVQALADGRLLRTTETQANDLLRTAEPCPSRIYALLRARTPFAPYTVFRNVLWVPPYESLTSAPRVGDVCVHELSEPYEFLSRFEERRHPYDRAKIEELLMAAVMQSTRGRSDVLLLLSEGKDSTPLARALANCGIRARCVTFATPESQTAEFTSSIAKKYGHEHLLVDVDKLQLEPLLTVFRDLSFPTVDFGALGYAYLVAEGLTNSSTVVIDGSGNDRYMGPAVSPREHHLHTVRRLTGYCPYLSLKRKAPTPAYAAYNLFSDVDRPIPEYEVPLTRIMHEPQ